MVPIAVSFASKAELSAHLRSSTSPEQLVVIYIWADWHPSHANMAKVFASLGVKYSHANIQLLTLDASADSSSALLSELDVEAVPTFLFFKNSTPVGRVSGSSPQLLNQQFAAALSASVPVAEPAPTATPTPAPAPNAADLVPANLPLQERLAQLVAVAPCTIFIKGTPEKPRCGFTRQLLQILHDNNVSFASFDILEDNEVREGLKKFSDWPTYPQVYANGELVGGLDIIRELVASGELADMLPIRAATPAPAAPTPAAAAPGQTLEDRLRALITREPIMLFMKGNPAQPRCGFSRQIVALLQKHTTAFGTFDILEDNEVREGLKKFSDWPTYPQVYVKGELLGGLDILKQMDAGDELAEYLGLE